ncbi:MAG: tetratricopeptide repeat protein [Planctomycetota bacterium]|nr:tetratricopeptide repeat protein [Planctomycetota bacterium]
MKTIALSLSVIALALLVAGCDSGPRRSTGTPVRTGTRVKLPPKVKLLGIKHLSISEVKETKAPRDNPSVPDVADSSEMFKSSLLASLCGSPYQIVDAEILNLAADGKFVKYAPSKAGVRSDFLSEIVSSPSTVGIVDVDLKTSFGSNYFTGHRVENLELRDFTRPQAYLAYTAAPLGQVQVPVHSVTVGGEVSATIRIRDWKEKKVLFEKSYSEQFAWESGTGGKAEFFALFAPPKSGYTGDAPPTLTEAKALLFQKIADAFAKDVCPYYEWMPLEVDGRGDIMAANLLRSGAYEPAERRLRKVFKLNDPAYGTPAANGFNLGAAYEGQGFYMEAVSQYKQALKQEPGNAFFTKSIQRLEKITGKTD